RLGHRPEASRRSAGTAVVQKLIRQQTGAIAAVALDVAVESIDLALHVASRRPLVPAQQPDPFAMVAGLDHVSRLARRRPPFLVEILEQDAVFWLEEAFGEQPVHLAGPFEITALVSVLPEIEECLEQMHVRVLPSRPPAPRQG